MPKNSTIVRSCQEKEYIFYMTHSLITRATPSQQPDMTTAYQAIFAQVGESHLRCRINPTDIT